jgi:enoyl-CoA hydratase/carnithine racemase
MHFEAILVGKKDQIGIITLNRPQKFNTFNSRMAEELNTALCQLDEEAEVRVVIVKGSGKVFSTGIDVGEFHGKTPSEYHGSDALHHCFYGKTCDCYGSRICGR